jgi:hypothetical protein
VQQEVAERMDDAIADVLMGHSPRRG